jgi:hypothetical protein
MKAMLVSVLCVSAVALAAGCSDDSESRSCADLCTEAQAGHCTAITGSCGAFCSALDAVQGPSGCTSQRSAYQSCVSSGATACTNNCDSQESALSNCVGTYCLAHTTDANCVTLASSF